MTEDFAITGDEPANWNGADWNDITQRDKIPSSRITGIQRDCLNTIFNIKRSLKVLYSAKGIYCLFLAEDSLLTVTNKADNTPLYNEDVVEVLKPDGDGNDYLNTNCRRGILNCP